MRRWILHALFLVGLCAVFVTGSASQADSQIPVSATEVHPLLIGAMVPSVSLRDANGGPIELTDVLGGKPTILFFYRGGW